MKQGIWRRCGRRLALLPLALALAGCFQQAGEAFQPVSSTLLPASDLSTLPPDAAPTTAGLDLPVTPTLPPITLIAPTRAVLATPLPTEAPTQDVSRPATDVAFRTPVSPLGPVTPVQTSVPLGPPTTTPSGLITPTAFGEGGSAGAAPAGCAYTVRPGDTLFRIAGANNTTLAALREANPQVTGDLIQPGQVLKLPDCDAETSGAPPVATSVAAPTNPPAEVEGPPPGGVTYVVQRGDTLYGIARRYGITVQALVNANKLANPNRLDVGQQLIIPPVSN